MNRRWTPALGCALGILAYSAATLADSAATAEAQRLFDEAKVLAEHDQWSQACPRLAESLRLEPNMTTEFRLADCYERVGRVASAWTHYSAAARSASAAGEGDKSRVAAERAARLEPRVDRLVIIPPAMPDVRVERDGRAVPREAWNTAQPADPGEHTVHVSAPGKTSYDALVTFTGTGEVRRVEVPVLEPALPWRLASGAPTVLFDPPRPAAETPQSPPRKGSVLRTIGWGIFAAGSATVVTGVALYTAEAVRTDPCANGRCVPSVALLGAGSVAVILGSLLVLASQ